MLKNILKLNGAQQLSKKELQTISGGNRLCLAVARDYDGSGCYCNSGLSCINVAANATCSNGSAPFCP
jgi:bacteriocin-like protein